MTLRKPLEAASPKEAMPTYFVDSDWPKSTFSRSEVYVKKKECYWMISSIWYVCKIFQKKIISYPLLRNNISEPLVCVHIKG